MTAYDRLRVFDRFVKRVKIVRRIRLSRNQPHRMMELLRYSTQIAHKATAFSAVNFAFQATSQFRPDDRACIALSFSFQESGIVFFHVVLDEVAAFIALSADCQRTSRAAAKVVFRLADHLQQRGVLRGTQFSWR